MGSKKGKPTAIDKQIAARIDAKWRERGRRPSLTQIGNDWKPAPITQPAVSHYKAGGQRFNSVAINNFARALECKPTDLDPDFHARSGVDHEDLVLDWPFENVSKEEIVNLPTPHRREVEAAMLRALGKLESAVAPAKIPSRKL